MITVSLKSKLLNPNFIKKMIYFDIFIHSQSSLSSIHPIFSIQENFTLKSFTYLALRSFKELSNGHVWLFLVSKTTHCAWCNLATKHPRLVSSFVFWERVEGGSARPRPSICPQRPAKKIRIIGMISEERSMSRSPLATVFSED